MASKAYSIVFSARLSVSAGTIVPGDVLIPEAGTGVFVKATTANRGSRRSFGVALTSASGGGSVQYQEAGILSAPESGLSPGASSWVRVSTTGRLERCTPSGSDDLVGTCNDDGDVFLLCGQWTPAIVNGAGSVPTGTGFRHITSGSEDAAAVAVNLGTADVTGVLPTAKQAAQSMGGDVGGTTAAATIANLALTKLAPGSNGQWITTTGGVAAWANPSFAASAITSGSLGTARGGLGLDASGSSGFVLLTGGAVSFIAAPAGSLVGTTASQSLTNKTIDADQNTITNIENADIKAAAAIAGTKISPNWGSQNAVTTGTTEAGSYIVGASGPTITKGTGAPATAPPDGSIYLRTNGTSSTGVYTRQAGVWSALGGGGGGVSPGTAAQIFSTDDTGAATEWRSYFANDVAANVPATGLVRVSENDTDVIAGFSGVGVAYAPSGAAWVFGNNGQYSNLYGYQVGIYSNAAPPTAYDGVAVLTTDLSCRSIYLLADFTTTSTTRQSTNLVFNIAANEIWEVEFDGAVGSSGGTGIQLAWDVPAGCTAVSRVFGCTSGSTAFTSTISSTVNALIATTLSNAASAARMAKVSALITNGANAGTITLQIAAVTSGTARMYAGSYLKARRATGV